MNRINWSTPPDASTQVGRVEYPPIWMKPEFLALAAGVVFVLGLAAGLGLAQP